MIPANCVTGFPFDSRGVGPAHSFHFDGVATEFVFQNIFSVDHGSSLRRRVTDASGVGEMFCILNEFMVVNPCASQVRESV